MIKNKETTIMRYSSKCDYLILFTGIRVDKLFEYERYQTDECKFYYQNVVLSIESQTWKILIPIESSILILRNECWTK